MSFLNIACKNLVGRQTWKTSTQIFVCVFWVTLIHMQSESHSQWKLLRRTFTVMLPWREMRLALYMQKCKQFYLSDYECFLFSLICLIIFSTMNIYIYVCNMKITISFLQRLIFKFAQLYPLPVAGIQKVGLQRVPTMLYLVLVNLKWFHRIPSCYWRCSCSSRNPLPSRCGWRSSHCWRRSSAHQSLPGWVSRYCLTGRKRHRLKKLQSKLAEVGEEHKDSLCSKQSTWKLVFLRNKLWLYHETNQIVGMFSL